MELKLYKKCEIDKEICYMHKIILPTYLAMMLIIIISKYPKISL